MENFWDFSVRHYAKPGVAGACLALQDKCGLDVNLVLFSIWYGRNTGELSQSQLDRVMDFSELWATSVVKPLRQTRRWIKQSREECAVPPDRLEKFRSKVKQLELEAEHLQQDQLQQLISKHDTESETASEDAVNRNLDAYLLRKRVERNAEVDALLAAVV